MRIFDGKEYREMTDEEMEIFEARRVEEEREYWQNIVYDDGVNAEIRKRYTESQEFAILRQKDDKPDDYNAYYAYCEECKAFVKAKKEEYGQA